MSAQTNFDSTSTVTPRDKFTNIDHPSYYHLHIHIVHTDLDATNGMSIGKAHLLDDVLTLLTHLGPAGLKQTTMHIILGEESDLWKQVYSKFL
jgi:hypothetical protein